MSIVPYQRDTWSVFRALRPVLSKANAANHVGTAQAGQHGVTLIEVVVATAIFALVVFVLSGFYLTASSRGYLGRTETGAALLAQQRLEVLRAKAYVSLPGFAGTETIDELGNATPDGLFTRVTAITTPYLGSADLTQVSVTVNWLDRDTPHTYTIETVAVNLP